MNQSFKLYDLRVSVTGDPATFVCNHQVGDNFTVRGEDIIFDYGKDRFSQYALAALLPLLPAKQRPTEPADWISTDQDIACPDPNCGARFTITRLDMSTFNHDDVTKVPMDTEAES